MTTDIPSTDASTKFIVRSELMEDYFVGSPYQAQPMVASVVDGDGVVQVFSLGSDQDIYNIYPDSDQEDGWSIRKLGMSTTVKSFAVGVDLRGSVVVFAVDDDNNIYWKSDRSWSEWVNLGNPFDAGAVIKSVRTGYDSAGNLLAMAIGTFTTNIGNWKFAPTTADAVVRIYWNDSEQTWDYVSAFIDAAAQIHDCIPGATGGTSGGAFVSVGTVAAESSGLPGGLTFFLEHRRQFRSFWSSSTLDLTTLSGVLTNFGTTEVFALDDNSPQGAYYIDQSAKMGPDALLQLQFAGTADSVVAIRGSIDPHNKDRDVLEVFALGANGNLYHARQELVATSSNDGAPESSDYTLQWQPLISLGGNFAANADNLTVCRDALGNTQCFLVGGDGKLINISQNANDEWSFTPIETPYKGELQGPYSCYSTDVTYIDAEGGAIPFQAMRVATSSGVRVNINGETYSVGPDDPVDCMTNAAGRINVTVPTGKLGTPSFTVSAGSLGESDVLAIRPDQYIQDQLYPPASGDQSGSEVLADQIVQWGLASSSDPDLSAASQAIWYSASLAQQDPGDPTLNARYISPRGDMRGVRVISGPHTAVQSGRIDPSLVPAQHWQIRKTRMGLVFRQFHSHDEAMAAMAQMRAVASAKNESLKKSSNFTIHKPDWGDVWDSVRRGAAEVESILITTEHEVVEAGKEVVSGIVSAMSFLVDGVTYAFDYAIDMVEQTFDMILGAFEWIEVKFEDLFKVLGTLFSWQGVLQVKENLKTFMTQMLAKIPAQMTSLQAKIDEYFGQLQQSLDLGPLAGVTIGSQTETAYSDANGKAPGPSSNWAQSKLLDGMDGTMTTPLNPDEFAGLSGPIGEFFKAIVDALKPRLADLMAKIQTAVIMLRGDGPGALTSMSIEQIFTVCGELVASGLLDILQAIVDAAFTLVRELLDAAAKLLEKVWYVPVLSQLYKKIANADLSLLDLICLVIGLPTYFFMQLLELGNIGQTSLVAASAAGISRETAEEDADFILQTYILGAGFSAAVLYHAAFSAAVGSFALPSLKAAPKEIRVIAKMCETFFSAAGLLLSFDFYFYPPKTKAEDVAAFNWAFGCLQWLVVDLIGVVADMGVSPRGVQDQVAAPQDGMARNEAIMAMLAEQGQPTEAWEQTFNRILGDLREPVEKAEKSELLAGLIDLSLQFVGAGMSVILILGYIAEGVLEGVELSEHDGFDIAQVTLKTVQNVLLPFDEIVPLATALFKWPQPTVKGVAMAVFYGGTAVADGGASVINGVRIGLSAAHHVPHDNR